MSSDNVPQLFKSGWFAGYAAAMKEVKDREKGILIPANTKQCDGMLEFQQEIHNGNDAYKCSKCGGVLVVKILESSTCGKTIQVVSYETIPNNETN